MNEDAATVLAVLLVLIPLAFGIFAFIRIIKAKIAQERRDRESIRRDFPTPPTHEQWQAEWASLQREREHLDKSLKVQGAVLEQQNKQRFEAIMSFALARLEDLASEHQLCADTTEIPEALHTSALYREGFYDAWKACNEQCAFELRHRVRQIRRTSDYASWKRKYELRDMT
jgi:hypothetical protein